MQNFYQLQLRNGHNEWRERADAADARLTKSKSRPPRNKAAPVNVDGPSSLVVPETTERPAAPIARSRSPSRVEVRPPRVAVRGGNAIDKAAAAAAIGTGAAGGGTGTSSYWSVPESTDFPKMLDHFGTDWQAIASHMTSKTSVMVSDVDSLGIRYETDE